MIEFADKGLIPYWKKIFNWFSNEDVNQIAKWGFQVHSSFEWLTYTAEELGSLAKAISEFEYRNGSQEKVISEAVQVATLAIKIAVMFNETIKQEETR